MFTHSRCKGNESKHMMQIYKQTIHIIAYGLHTFFYCERILFVKKKINRKLEISCIDES